MSILELCERLQDTWVSRAISESTWGYPTIGAVHVLAMALFGGAMLVPHVRPLGFLALDVRWIRRVGLTVVVVTGSLLFAAGAVGYSRSTSFKIKLALLGLIAMNSIAFPSRQPRGRLRSAIALVLWGAVIFASRGIAFF